MSEALHLDKKQVADRLEALGWGLFFIWLGAALLFDVGLAMGLLGVGVITLGIQFARKRYSIPVEPFWVGIGAIFLVGGAWQLLSIKLPLLPVLLILAGVLLILSKFRPTK